MDGILMKKNRQMKIGTVKETTKRKKDTTLEKEKPMES
jgi:hypothetical protein